jgi:hypothetical protein
MAFHTYARKVWQSMKTKQTCPALGARGASAAAGRALDQKSPCKVTNYPLQMLQMSKLTLSTVGQICLVLTECRDTAQMLYKNNK